MNPQVGRLAFGPFQLDATGDLRDATGLVPLTPKALSLLGYLASRAGSLVSTRELLDAVWPDVFVGDGALKVCVREIRRALGDDAREPRFIETAHRRGYRFIAAVRETAPPVSGLAGRVAAGVGIAASTAVPVPLAEPTTSRIAASHADPIAGPAAALIAGDVARGFPAGFTNGLTNGFTNGSTNDCTDGVPPAAPTGIPTGMLNGVLHGAVNGCASSPGAGGAAGSFATSFAASHAASVGAGAATAGAPFVAPAGATAGMVPSAAIPVHYARSGDVNIAYQVLGSGPIDLVFVMGWVSHLEYYWREPGFARFLQRLASFSRLILFDKRGTGLSDPVAHVPTLEQRMDDVRAVMDAVGSERAVLLGVSEGGPMCSLFAATYPSRTEALVMIGTYARRLRAPDYPWAPTDEQRESFCREILARWGGPVGLEARAPTVANDPAFRDWWATYLRMGASPSAAVALTRMNAQIDIRHILPSVRVPALVLHRTGDRCLHVEEGRFVASRIPDARFVELPGDDHLPFVGESGALLDEVERFVSRRWPRADDRRMLATILCLTTGVDECAERVERQAERQAEPGATAQETLCALARVEVERFGGGSMQRTDGSVVVLFDGPARAIRCGRAIAASAAAHGLRLRTGVHAGECAIVAGTAQGLAVEICHRIAQHARPGDVLVSRTVVDLVAGSGLRFTDRGRHPLTNDLSDWQVFAADDERAGLAPETPALAAAL